MNNEPVAWMLADKEKEYIRSIMAVQHDFVPQGCVEIPLYTHPVKELTDSELTDIWKNKLCNQDCPREVYLAFYKEIRKAQE